jgi:multicomponent Na+:H+ antiporter subunit D
VRPTLALPVAVPLAGAAVTALLGARLTAQRVVTFASLAFLTAYATALLVVTAREEAIATQLGAWPPGFAIPFAADPLSALMLLIAGAMALVCVAFAVARGEDERRFFYPLVLFLMAGASGAFLTADFFNLFVFVEVMLIASYVLLALDGARDQIRSGTVYVAVNLLASTLLVAAVAFMYGAAGTVNMAALEGAGAERGVVAVAAAALLIAFAVKSSLVPVHGWLPRSYPVASPSVTALFSGILTKVGVYAIIRTYSLVFSGNTTLRAPILVVAAATMLIGVLGAVGRDRIRDILAFHMVSQVGYIVLGLGLFGVAGLAAGIFYMIQYIVVKTSLFLSAGAVETLEGSGELKRLGGIARVRPVLAAGFVISALSLSGLPPFSGFFAKLFLVRAAFEDASYAAAGMAILVSFFTLMSMLKIWSGAFWGAREESLGRPEPVPTRRAAGLVAPALVLAGVTVALGFGAQGLLEISNRAAEALVDPASYVGAVLGG